MKKVIVKQLGKRISFKGINIATPCKFFIADEHVGAFKAYCKVIGLSKYEIKDVKKVATNKAKKVAEKKIEKKAEEVKIIKKEEKEDKKKKK